MLERSEWLSMALGLCLGFVLCGTIVSMILDWPSQAPTNRDKHVERDVHAEGEKSADNLNDGKPDIAVQIIQSDHDKKKERREEARAEEKAAIDDGVLFWTRGLVGVTARLAVVTFMLYWSTRQIATDAMEISKGTTKTLVSMERPYVTVGGEYKRDRKWQRILRNSAGKRFFRLEIGNYGKTPALLTAYEVRFAKLATVQATESDIDRKNGTPHPDWLAPRERHKVIADDIVFDPVTDQVVYGAIWYRNPLEEGQPEVVSSFCLDVGVQWDRFQCSRRAPQLPEAHLVQERVRKEHRPVGAALPKG
jgi:hypothetical protein